MHRAMRHPVFAFLPAACLVLSILPILGWLEWRDAKGTGEHAIIFAPGTEREDVFNALRPVNGLQFVRFGGPSFIAVVRASDGILPDTSVMGAWAVVAIPKFGSCFAYATYMNKGRLARTGNRLG